MQQCNGDDSLLTGKFKRACVGKPLSFSTNYSHIDSYCDWYWDHSICWPRTPPNTTIALQCPQVKGYDTSSMEFILFSCIGSD